MTHFITHLVNNRTHERHQRSKILPTLCDDKTQGLRSHAGEASALFTRCLRLDSIPKDGQSRTFECSRTVLELNISNLEFRTRSIKLEAFRQNDMINT